MPNINWIQNGSTQNVIDFATYMEANPEIIEFETLAEAVNGNSLGTTINNSSEGVILNFKTATPSQTGGSTTSIVFKEVEPIDTGFAVKAGNIAFYLTLADIFVQLTSAFGIYINDRIAISQGKNPRNEFFEAYARLVGKTADEVRDGFLYTLCEADFGEVNTYIPFDVLQTAMQALIDCDLAFDPTGYKYENTPRGEEIITHGSDIPMGSTVILLNSALGGAQFNQASFKWDANTVLEAKSRLVANCPNAYAVTVSYNVDKANTLYMSALYLDSLSGYEAFKWDENLGILKGKIINTESWQTVTFKEKGVDITSTGSIHEYQFDEATQDLRESGLEADASGGRFFTAGVIGTRMIPIEVPDYVQYIGDPLKNNSPFELQYPDWYRNLLYKNGIGFDTEGNPFIQSIPHITLQTHPMSGEDPNNQKETQRGKVVVTDPNPIPRPQPSPLPPIPTPTPEPPTPTPEPPEPIDPEPTPNPEPTPTPPIPPIPFGTASKLFTVHDLRSDEVDALGGFLWSNNFISQIASMFTQPSDAVISLGVLHYSGNLPLGSNEVIKLGSVNTVTCTGTRVTSQYHTFSCGSVTIPEYWGCVEDYEPYTKAQIYLPYVGFRNISANEIMGCQVNLTYTIDIYTGACIASISRVKDGVSQEIYNFEGNCSVQQPVTAGNFSQFTSNLLKMAVGYAVGSGATMASSATGLLNSQATFLRSGNFSPNHGACANQQPFILLERPVPFNADNYPHYYGNPSNMTVTLGICRGYTRVKDVHVENINCTNEEKAEIESLLKQGVIFNS